MTATPLECWSDPHQQAIRAQLGRILKSGPFHQSRRRQRFLEYLIVETLAGRGERLKGYNLAVEVFDRPETFDPLVDPLVRIEAGRLREKLREYYEAEGRGDPVRIDLPKGSYTPLIAFRDQEPAQPAPPADVAEPSPSAAMVEPAPLADGEQQPPPQPPSRLRWQMVVPAAAIVLLLGLLGAWFRQTPVVKEAEQPLSVAALGLADVPAIAVMPFLNLSGDPQQDYFSDGLTEDILTELAQVRDLRVIARNTTFQFKGKSLDIAKLGRDLKVRYVLEGSARRADDRLRVSAQLIDTATGTHVWAERYDREMTDILLVQGEIVNQIVAKIAGGYGAIQTAEARSAARKNPSEVKAYDLVLRARDAMQWDWTDETFRKARSSLDQAVVLDPVNAQAHRELAWLAVVGWVFGLDETPVLPETITMEAAKAVQLDPTDARARMVAASAYFFTKQLDLFGHETDVALTLAPYDAEIIATLACMISSAGDHARGVDLAKKAYALNADAVIGWYHSTIYTALYLAGDYPHALEVARQNQDSEMFYSYLEIIPIYGQLGMKKEAVEALQNLRKTVPNATAETFENWWRLWNIHDAEVARLMDGVRKSGVLDPAVAPGQ